MGFKVKSLTKVVKGAAKGFSKLVKSAAKVIGGDILDDILGLDSIGKEVERWGEDIAQVVDVVSGKYHDDMKALKAREELVNRKIEGYKVEVSKLEERQEALVAFDEIFKMSAQNRLEQYVGKHGPEIDKLIAEYNNAMNQLKSEYDFIIGLSEGNFLGKVVASLLMIVGGLVSDIGDLLSGKADGDTFKRLLASVVAVVMVIVSIIIPMSIPATTAIILAAIGAFLILDSTYANGVGMAGIMDLLDFAFNDLLQLDSIIGSDFQKFDSDHEDYQEMQQYVKWAFTLTSIYVAWVSAPAQTTSVATQSMAGGLSVSSLAATSTELTIGQSIANTAAAQTAFQGTSSYLGGALQVGSSASTSSLLGVSFTTYGQIYKAYSAASAAKDVVTANKLHKDLENKLREDQLKLEQAITKKIANNFMKSYNDTAYFLQDQQEIIDRYVYSMTAQNMYVDPYGTTPVANMRFTPDKDTRILSFGFEDVFDDSKQAGSASYFNNILYGS